MAKQKKVPVNSEAIGDRQYIPIPDEMVQAQLQLIDETPGIGSYRLAELLLKKNARWAPFLFRRHPALMLNKQALDKISACKTAEKARKAFNASVVDANEIDLYELDLRVISAIKRRANKDAGKTVIYSSRLIGYWPANKIKKHTLSIWLQQKLDRIGVEVSMSLDGCRKLSELSTEKERSTVNLVGNALDSVNQKDIAASIGELAKTYGIKAR